MPQRLNEFDQPIGDDVTDWQTLAWPPRAPMVGRFCRLEALDAARHAQDLYDAFSEDVDGKMWTYLFVGPFGSFNAVKKWIETISPKGNIDPLFYAIIDNKTDKAIGMASYLRIDPSAGVIEVGNIAFSPALQKTPVATETMFLMMQRVFSELGYRRYEWKCDSLNAPSRRAAQRFGFTYDGLFKQAIMYKGRNRDTTWYSILDKDWANLEKAHRQWLDPENFDNAGHQKQRLGDLITLAR